jgi:hypothetical protein
MMPMMTVGMLVMGASSRVRFRAHYGSAQDINYKLTTFGIPDKCLPVTDDGEPKIKSHRAWVKSRKQQEDRGRLGVAPNDRIVVVPGRVDVLLGRGKPIQEHFGNLRYHILLDHYQDAYEGAKKFEKMQIAQRIVSLVHEYNGRFLRQEGAGWCEVDDSAARDKVSHAFRTRRATQLGNSSISNGATAPRNKRRADEDGEESSASATAIVLPVLSSDFGLNTNSTGPQSSTYSTGATKTAAVSNPAFSTSSLNNSRNIATNHDQDAFDDDFQMNFHDVAEDQTGPSILDEEGNFGMGFAESSSNEAHDGISDTLNYKEQGI